MRSSLQGVCLAASLTLLCAPTGFAQDPVQLDHYRPAATGDDGFALSRPTDRGHLRWGARLDLDYALNPLVVEGRLGDADSELQSVVEHQLVGHLGVSLGLFDRIVAYVGLPVNLVNSGEAFGPVPGGDGAGIGDVRLGVRGRLWGEAEDAFVLGAQLDVSFPLAEAIDGDQAYTGEAGVVVHPRLLGEVRVADRFRVTGNVGARIRGAGTADNVNLDLSHELTYGLGATFAAVPDRLDVHLELFGAQTFANIAGSGARESGPFEGLVGARVAATDELHLGLAAGMGFTRGYGSPDFRGVLQFDYTQAAAEEAAPVDTDGDGLFDEADGCPAEPEDADGFEDEDGCPDPDNDSDGILDDDDRCPTEPETVNDYQDEDGCADAIPDTDGDGLLDNVDQCPEEAEDVDEFEDADGCPDADNDADGVLDPVDRCAQEAGPAANHGCPDTDRDTDTVVDRLDACPDVAGSPQFGGCPNDLQIRIEDGRLEILDRVHFRTDRAVIQRRSHRLLRNVAMVLNNHPEITRIIIAGHTDDRGSDEYNMDLSQRRAEAVRDFLVEAGVDPSRLEARGFGKTQPVVPNARTRAERAQNRRVEFNLPPDSLPTGLVQQNSAAGADTIDR